ncbi:hypothetical protein DFA_07668 [Cavenderia fasciculata]|uniref:intramembrane prenyl-peptidase Rce1 n=1 Tax=Cavenderia fasciculata TaxID=261658 RepID=F4Q2L1_CACFS|nr:uncharacterized protein DFA_07668 [Cavenderia fasciculata]EGG16690.1 hypothetical protein DFA_07668 [Cavenderia fasciculata]|eukprot:XP_004355164.1 hypothetical protein DFA_07668 [Cavenderia fasciculata]
MDGELSSSLSIPEDLEPKTTSQDDSHPIVVGTICDNKQVNEVEKKSGSSLNNNAFDKLMESLEQLSIEKKDENIKENNNNNNNNNTNANTNTNTEEEEEEEEEEEKDPKLQCPVCSDRIKDHKLIKCSHVFCKECIDSYIKRRMRKCPVCMAPFTVDDIQEIMMEIVYPQLGGSESILLSIFFTVLFVGSIYVIGPGHRDDPQVIKNRFKSVFSSSFIAYLVLYFIIPQQSNIIGVNVESMLLGILQPLLLTVILFFGPLVMLYVDYDLEDPPFTFKDFNIYWLRNFVVGPSAEEMVFRSVICPILYFAGFSSTSIILCSPLLFGLAHVHHIYPWKGKKLSHFIVVIFQVVYTSLFGMYSSFIFMRTGNLFSCIIAHCFCNMMGLPNFSDVPDHDKKILLSICFIVGLVGFIFLIPILVDPTSFNTLLLFVVASYCQPESLQFFYQWPNVDYITFQVLRLQDGETLQNMTNINEGRFGIWAFLTTNDTNEILLVGSSSNGIQVKSFWPIDGELQPEWIGYAQFNYVFALQPVLWDQWTLFVYVPGLTYAGSSQLGTLALLEFNFEDSQKYSPIILGISETTTNRFNSNPIGAYDGTNNYYVYYSIGSELGIVQYSFSQQSTNKVVLADQAQAFTGNDQLFYYNGLLYYCKYVKQVGVTISSINVQSGGTTNIVYKDNSSNKGFQQNIQPFVFDPLSGSILILNTNGNILYIDTFIISSQKTISTTLPNTIPSGTNIIAPSLLNA